MLRSVKLHVVPFDWALVWALTAALPGPGTVWPLIGLNPPQVRLLFFLSETRTI